MVTSMRVVMLVSMLVMAITASMCKVSFNVMQLKLRNLNKMSNRVHV